MKVIGKVDFALSYADLGWHVFPLSAGQKVPLVGSRGFKDATTDKNLIRRWWVEHSEANIGIRTGIASNLAVVDVDVKNGQPGLESLKALPGIIPTLIAKTPSGGFHHYFAIDDQASFRCMTGFLPGLDFRAEGGYVVAPGSVVDGKEYTWEDPEAHLVSISPELEAALNAYNSPRPDIPSIISGTIQNGIRNTSLTSLAGAMRRKGMTEKAIEAALLVENQVKCSPPLSEKEVKTISASVAKYSPEESKAEKKSKANIVNLADVVPEKVEWLWPGRIPLGKLTLVTGNPGIGKSLFLVDLSARVSAGKTWPVDGSKATVGDVLLLSAEDGLSDTIRPRLEAAGAEIQRCHALTMVKAEKNGETVDRLFDLSRDVNQLDEFLQQHRQTKLLTIDPVSAYLGKTEENSNGEVRGVLAPLAALAEKFGIAIVLLSHTNKQGGMKALHRNLGSVGFVAAARAAYLVLKDEENPERRLFLPTKNNLAPDTGGLAYRVIAPSGVPCLEWENTSVSISADEALSREGGGESPGEEATDWLRNFLMDGPATAEEVKKASQNEGYSWRTVERAKRKAGVKSERQGFGKGAKYKWSIAQ